MRKLALAVVIAILLAVNATASDLYQLRFFKKISSGAWFDSGSSCIEFRTLLPDDQVLSFGNLACKAVTTCLFLTPCGGDSSSISMTNGAEAFNAPGNTSTYGCVAEAGISANASSSPYGLGWQVSTTATAYSNGGLFTPETSVNAFTVKYCLDFGSFQPNGQMSLGGVYTEYSPPGGEDVQCCRFDVYGTAKAYIRAYQQP
mgnify:CR=1 FL=1